MGLRGLLGQQNLTRDETTWQTRDKNSFPGQVSRLLASNKIQAAIMAPDSDLPIESIPLPTHLQITFKQVEYHCLPEFF